MELAVAPNTKTKTVSGFRTVVRQVHLWLGLSAGLILALVGLSGAGLVFAEQMVKQEAPPFSRMSGREMAAGFRMDCRRGEKISRPCAAEVRFRTGHDPDADRRADLFKNTEHNGAERHTLIPIDPVKGIALQRSTPKIPERAGWSSFTRSFLLTMWGF